jgi:hypothetical protein
MIAASYSNPNWDGKENSEKRQEYLREINRHFNDAITALYHPDGPKELDVDWSNPFFAAHKREIERTKEAFRLQLEGQGKTAEDLMKEEEQSGNGRWDDIDQIPRNN